MLFPNPYSWEIAIAENALPDRIPATNIVAKVFDLLERLNWFIKYLLKVNESKYKIMFS